jgi:hypothetical protein
MYCRSTRVTTSTGTAWRATRTRARVASAGYHLMICSCVDVGMKEDADVDSIEWTCRACLIKDKQRLRRAAARALTFDS